MSAQQMLAASLILSVLASGAAWGVGALIERISDDPRLRDRVWGAGLIFGLLPVLAVGVLVLTPAPVREVVAPAAPVFVSETIASAPAPAVVQRPVWPGPDTLSWAVLIAAAAFGLIRLIALALRTFRLARLIARAVPVGPDLPPRIEGIASRLKVQAPLAFIDAASGEALLTGLGRPRLILPASDHPVADAVIAHELAHLKRGDHRTLWLEEAIAVLLAFNPMIPVLRARRDAAREEACDALALSGADAETRRAYAQTLIQALRDRAGSQGSRGPRVALTFTGAARKAAMNRLNAVTTPAAPAGRRVRWVALSVITSLAATIGAASWAVADQRQPTTISRAEAVVPTSRPDFAYVGAALDPVYRAAWPDACGFGSEDDERVFVYAGDCTNGGGTKIEVLSLAGVDFSTEARDAFAAVKASCDAGRPVEIAYAEGSARGRTSVACLSPAVAPPEPVRFTVDLSYDPAIRIAAGDRLEIDLRRNMEQGGTASTGIVLNLAPGVMPGQAFAELRPPLLPTDLRAGPMFALSARIVGVDGTVKALSDRDLDRPHAPYINSAGSISTAMQMLPADIAPGEAAARRAAQTAASALPPETLARFQRASASDYRTYCASDDPGEEGFCAGVMLSHLGRAPGNGMCLPDVSGNRRGVLGNFIARGKAEVARLNPRRDEGAYEYSERALNAAYPCPTSVRGTAASQPPAAQAYQARLIITEGGQVVAAGRMRVHPDDSAMTVLSADGREYQFELSLEGPDNDPENRGRLTARADVARTASAGGWETVAQPVLLMRPDGQARMTWGDEAGLAFDIFVEPA